MTVNFHDWINVAHHKMSKHNGMTLSVYDAKYNINVFWVF